MFGRHIDNMGDRRRPLLSCRRNTPKLCFSDSLLTTIVIVVDLLKQVGVVYGGTKKAATFFDCSSFKNSTDCYDSWHWSKRI